MTDRVKIKELISMCEDLSCEILDVKFSEPAPSIIVEDMLKIQLEILKLLEKNI